MEYVPCKDGETARRIRIYVKWISIRAFTFLEFMMDTEVNLCQV
jgi:hypothetical protein